MTVRRLFDDTDPEVEEIHLRLLSAAPLERRTALALSLSRSTLELARRRLAGLHPQADEWEIGWRLVTLLYGEALGTELRQALTSRA